MDLRTALLPGCCCASLEGEDKETLIKGLVDLSLHHPALEGIERSVILEGILSREARGSTGVGNRLAVPHCEVPGLQELVTVLGTKKEGLHFDSLDGEPVHLFFMILSPQGGSAEHLQCLSSFAQLASQESFLIDLLGAKTGEEVYQIFVKALD